MREISLKYCLLAGLFAMGGQLFSQHKTTKHEPAKDTLRNRAPQTPVLSLKSDCQGGTSLLMVELPPDTLARPDYILLYHMPVPLVQVYDSTPELILFRTIEYKELLAQNFSFAVENAGGFCAKAMRQGATGLLYSGYSNTVKINQCSFLSFPESFDKKSHPAFVPLALKNVQVTGFYIFDRLGAEVYAGKNNNISWDGNNPRQQPCPAGVYYYSCEYIDLAADGEKKSVSGMIELIL